VGFIGRVVDGDQRLSGKGDQRTDGSAGTVVGGAIADGGANRARVLSEPRISRGSAGPGAIADQGGGIAADRAGGAGG